MEKSTSAQHTFHRSVSLDRVTSSRVVNTAVKDPVTCYVTDAEGNAYYFVSITNRACPVVEFYDNNKLDWEQAFQENGFFVYGGDSVDKSSGDRFIVKSLTAFKKAYPERVTLILGNRDVNKLRLFDELHEDMDNKSALPDPNKISAKIYWDPNVWKPDGKSSYPKFLQNGANGIDKSCYVDGKLPHSWLSILLWILYCTMGAQPAFESRRLELAREAKKNPAEITNKEIYNDFYQSVNPNGKDPWMLEYIRLGQVVNRVHGTIFVHGAIKKKSLWAVPGQETKPTDLNTWFSTLNKWSSGMVQDWIDGHRKNPLNKAPQATAVGPLLDYALINIPMKNRSPTHTPAYHHNGTSIMYDNWLLNGNCTPIDKEVFEFLRDNEVDIVTGHQPHGDAPAPMLGYGKDLDGSKHIPLILSTDTSYSDSSRSAHSALTIYTDFCRVEGVLANGQDHGFDLERDSNARARSLIGRQLPDSSWVKSVSEGQMYVVRGEGFKVSSRLLPPQYIRHILDDISVFPKTLGPFKTLPLGKVALQYEMGKWTLPADALTPAVKAAFAKFSPGALSGPASPLFPVTLEGIAKSHANIPENATHYSYFHASLFFTDEQSKELQGINFNEPLICLLTVGAFGYFKQTADKKNSLLGVNVLKPDLQGGLQFDLCRPWNPKNTARVQPASRWIKVQTNHAVKYVAWVCLSEFGCAGSNDHGGFVFLSHEPNDTNPPPNALGNNIYFGAVGSDKVIVDILPEWLEHEKDALVQTGKSPVAIRTTPFTLISGP